MDIQTQYAAQKRLAACLRQAELYFSCRFPPPALSFNVRGKAAGKAYLQLNQIRLNPILFRENQQAFLDEVIPHELAHLITYQRFGRVKPHGAEWQMIMREVFGVEPHTTHQFEVTSVQGKTFEYRCDCQSYPLNVRRHNKVVRQQTQYRCQRCKSLLVFTGMPKSPQDA